jgi:hypothetical protein
MSMFVGEALCGEGNEIAHIDLLIGSKDGPVGVAFANALARLRWRWRRARRSALMAELRVALRRRATAAAWRLARRLAGSRPGPRKRVYGRPPAAPRRQRGAAAGQLQGRAARTRPRRRATPCRAALPPPSNLSQPTAGSASQARAYGQIVDLPRALGVLTRPV